MSRIAEGMHESGYQGLRTDKVIEALGITKGAFYHYFMDKPTVALAVIDEIHAKNYISTWEGLISTDTRIIDGLILRLEFVKSTVTDDNVHLGCPVNNLIQEMSPLDEVFRQKLVLIVSEELRLIGEAIDYGIRAAQIRPKVVAAVEALGVINGLEGAYSTSKLFRSKPMFDQGVDRIISQLRSLEV
jgi:AcrR family transcriptional regulator